MSENAPDKFVPTRESISSVLQVIQRLREHNPNRTLDMVGLNLAGLDLSGLDFRGAVLRHANFTNANLDGANLSEVNLIGADLDGASLVGTDLEGANLYHASLFGARLFKANLRRAELRFVTFTGSGLQKTVLDDANLSAAQFSVVNMANASLRRAKLLFTHFLGADVEGVDFAGAQFSSTAFIGVDLSRAIGLDSAEHDGPSYLDTATFRESKYSIPKKFLLGCGFSEWDQKAMDIGNPQLNPSSLRQQCEQLVTDRLTETGMKRAFISYSRKDQKFVDKLYKHLQQAGSIVWLDKHELLAGPLQKQVARAIAKQDVVILVLSQSSIQSDWVENELEMAYSIESAQSRPVLCPIAIDDAWKDKTSNPDEPSRVLWRKLPVNNILDFSKWKSKGFNEAFDKLRKGMVLNYDVSRPD